MRMKFFPLTSAEKLETKNGIRKRRMICQRSNLFPPVVELIKRAMPMMIARPNEVSQIRRLGSK